MADSLIDLPGSGASPVPCNPIRWRYPFRNNPVTVDIYSRILERDYRVAALGYNYVPAPFTTNTFINLAHYSETLQNAYWDRQTAITVLDGLARNPWDGTSTLTYLAETSATSAHFIARSAITISSAGTYCLSFFVLSTGASPFQLLITDGPNTNGFYANFDPSNGTVLKDATVIGSGSSASAGVQDLGIIPFGHYYRMWIKGKINGGITTAAAGMAFINSASATEYPSYTGTTRALYGGGFQFEAANSSNTLTPSTYLATTSADRTATLIPSSHAQIHPTDPVVDPFAICVAESDPAAGDAMLAGFTRSFARLPTPQIIPSSKYFLRPLMDDIFIAATAWAVSFDPFKRYSWVFTSRKSVSSVGQVILGTTVLTSAINNLPASTFTATDSTPTGSSPTLNAGAASIQSTLAAALTKLKNITVTSTADAVQIEWENNTGYMQSIATTATNVTMSGSLASKSVTFSINTTNTAAPNITPATRVVVCTGHGGAVGDYVVFWYNDRIIGRSKVLAVADADHFTIYADDISGTDIAPNYCGFSADAASCYVNGSKVCTTRRTTTFYMPGYSAGISTYADIPALTVYADALSWLGRILAVPTGWAVIEVADVTQYMGAMLMQEKVEIQMDDAIDTVTP